MTNNDRDSEASSAPAVQEKAKAAPEPAESAKVLFDEQKEEEGEIEEYTSRLDVFSRHPVQIVLGWVFGFLIWFTMAIGVVNSENELLSWLFLVVFAVAMIGRNYLERNGIVMRVFMKHFLISLIVFLGVFLLLGWTGVIDMNA